ncbi:hypothetical protein BaRGS_00015602 [Batillaria attramentaria]|uniref:Uncharacterized protein n=1 Tax=Batillaria attramentaria TaxID=370345 RepID=A0ABD0L153_9CAEN
MSAGKNFLLKVSRGMPKAKKLCQTLTFTEWTKSPVKPILQTDVSTIAFNRVATWPLETAQFRKTHKTQGFRLPVFPMTNFAAQTE